MNDILIWLAIVGASLGIAQDAHNIASGKDDLPKKSCGVETHWPRAITMMIAKTVINGFVGFAIGWVALQYLTLPPLGAVIIAGIAGGQGNKLFTMIMDKFYVKADKATDGDFL